MSVCDISFLMDSISSYCAYAGVLKAILITHINLTDNKAIVLMKVWQGVAVRRLLCIKISSFISVLTQSIFWLCHALFTFAVYTAILKPKKLLSISLNISAASFF